MHSGYITIGQHKVHCLRMGQGKKLLLCFHGYANTADMFAPVLQHLQNEYTIISIDLPHHGKTEWQRPHRMEVKELMAIVWMFRDEFKLEKVSLMGYSMGGRMCLKVVELMPEAVDKVILVAPDGLSLNAFYYFLTRTILGKKLFRSFLVKPERYYPVIDWARRRKIVSEARYKFAMQYLQTPESRNFLLDVWPAMCLVIPQNSRVRVMVNKYKIPVHLFMGSFDKVIPPDMGKRFKKGMDTVQLHIVNKGHRVMDEDTLPQIAQCLLS